MQVSESPLALCTGTYRRLPAIFAATTFLVGVPAYLELAICMSANGTVFLAVTTIADVYLAMNIGANKAASLNWPLAHQNG